MLLVDFSNMLFRYYHAAPPLTTSQGVPSGFEYLLFKGLQRLEKLDNNICLCLDSGCEWRKQLYPSYKQGRNHSQQELDDMYSRLAFIMPGLADRYQTLRRSGAEADDVIANYCLARRQPGEKVVILSNDKDYLQLVSDDITLCTTFRDKIYTYTPDIVFFKFKVQPYQFPYYKVLVGDKSDNIPGLARVNKLLIAEFVRQIPNFTSEAEQLNSIVLALEGIRARVHSSALEDLINKFLSSRIYEKTFAIINLIKDYAQDELAVTRPGEGSEYDRIVEEFEFYSISGKPSAEDEF